VDITTLNTYSLLISCVVTVVVYL